MAASLPPRDDNARSARQLTEKLLDAIETRHPVLADGNDEPLDIPIADIVMTVERFTQQYWLLNEIGAPFWCLTAGKDTPIPLDLGWTVSPRASTQSRDLWRRLADSTVRELSGLVARSSLGEFDPVEARLFLGARLQSFLNTRFSARESDISKRPGIEVRVDTRSRGLRVHVSPAYFFNSTTVFGTPTTPVIGWLQPGRYVFGASKPGKPADFDRYGEYNVPGTPRVALSL